jgi:hypothetical protein
MHINPEIADRFGFTILAIGAVLTGIGIVLAKSSKKG